MKKITVHIRGIRGYWTVVLQISKGQELLQEEFFDYTNKSIAKKKLVELKKRYKLVEDLRGFWTNGE